MQLDQWLADAIETAMLKPERFDPDNADSAAVLLFCAAPKGAKSATCEGERV
jgi:hypothetical protein